MLKERDEQRSCNDNSQLIEDIQYLLSSIRARQNNFVYFLERFKSFSFSDNAHEFQISRNQFQQKQKIYTSQINGVITKHYQTGTGNLQQQFFLSSPIRTFWIKLKSIIKVSIDRIKLININVQQIFNNYENALASINRCSEMQKGIIAYKQVQSYLKKRTIQAISLGRGVSPNSLSYSQSKIAKNRSQTLFKADIVSGFTLQENKSNIFSKCGQTAILNKDRYNKINKFEELQNIQEEKQQFVHPKIKSLNRQRFKRENYIKSNMLNFLKFQHLHKQKSSKASEKHLKKLNKHLQRYNKTLEGALQGKQEVLLDKKKSIYENIYSIYDNLFQRNIPNHKMISKFMFNTTKINQIIYSAYEKKKKIKRQKEKQKEKEKQKQKQKEKERQKQKTIKDVKQKPKDKQHIHRQKQILEIKPTKNFSKKLHFQKLQTLEQPHKGTNSNATTIAQEKKSIRPKTVKIKVNSFNGNQISRIPGSAHGKREKLINVLV